MQGGEHTAALAGTWRYRVERQTNAPALYGRPGELAAHVASAGTPPPADAVLAAAPATAKADVVLRLGVLKDQLKWDQTALTVGAGQLVDLVVTNTDVMPHNFVLGAAGSLDAIGAAADALMSSPTGAGPAVRARPARRSWPRPGCSNRASRSPSSSAPRARPAPIPYVCTFPGHWRVMNGVLTVTAGRPSEP